MSEWVPGKITQITYWTNQLFSIHVRAKINKFIPGQFTKIGIHTHNRFIQRAYSYLNSPNNQNLEFYIVKIQSGLLTPKLYNLKVGDALMISKKSYGKFILNEIPTCKNLWMIASGTGISPYLSILQSFDERLNNFSKIILIHAVRYLKNLNYLSIFNKLTNLYKNQLIVQTILSREYSPNSLFGHIPDLIENHFLEKKISLNINNNDHVMLCGNPGMITDTKNILYKKYGMITHSQKKIGHITQERYCNWKLHGNKQLVNNAIDFLSKNCTHISGKYQIIIAPPLVYLDTARNRLLNNNCIKLCAQNVDIHLSGAFTGDISALMLKDLGVQYALIGHSERRIHHQEQDLDIVKKFSILKKTGLVPILCIGENKKEQDSKITNQICINQIDSIIKALGIQSLQNTIIAYEPAWAIGTGISMLPEEAQLTHKNIRNHIAQYDSEIANKILIQYGGSVNKNNIIEFLSKKDINGVLIGSASLDIKNFYEIIKLIEIHINTSFII